jgi:hypothetical protein
LVWAYTSSAGAGYFSVSGWIWGYGSIFELEQVSTLICGRGLGTFWVGF